MDSTEVIKHFKGRSEWIAVGQGEGFRPERLEEPLTVERFEKEHLAQERCLGFYLMDPENQVHCSCLDFDNHPDNPDLDWRAKAETFYFLLCERGLSPVMEISSSGSGAHLWLHFTKPVPAFLVRNFWKKLALAAGVPVNEIYPRQDKLRDKGLGNLMRFPGWSRSRFANVEDDWEETELEVKPVDPEDLVEIAAELGHSLNTEPESPEGRLSDRVQQILKWPDSVLARRWRCDTDGLKGDTSKSTLAFCIARELVYQRVPTDQIQQSLKVWMLQSDYLKHIDDDRWIDRTIEKAYEIMHTREEEEEDDSVKKDMTLADCAKQFIRQIGTYTYMKSGINAIDNSIDGIAPGELALLAARPGHGKSALAVQWLMYQADQGVPTLLVSAEMNTTELGRRTTQIVVGGDEKLWVKHRKTVEEKISEHFDPKPKDPYVRFTRTMAEVESTVKYYVEKHGVSLVGVDYIQLLDGGKEGRYEEVTDISRRLKTLASKYNVGVLALCQISRGVERRESVQFNLSDLRESGQLEQDADLVLFGWWQGRGAVPDSSNHSYELHAIKRRNGPIRQARMELRFVPEKQLFCD